MKAKVNAGPIRADKLKSLVERIEKLEEERKAISGDIRDVYSEAKGVGYDVKIMRKIVSLRAMDAADRAEQETLLDTYKHALEMGDHDMEAQANARALERFREVDRCMRLAGDGNPPRIDAIMRELKCSSGKASSIRKLCVERISISSSDRNEIEPPHDANGIIQDHEEKASGPSRAEADIGASIEPAAVTPAVNADPLVGHKLPHDTSGQGSEVGTYSTSCGDPDSPSEIGRGPELSAALAASDRVRSSDAGVAPGPHDTESRSLAVPTSAEVDSADVPIRKDGRAGERDTVLAVPDVAAMLAASRAQADIDTAIPPFLDRRQKREAAA